MNNEEKLEQIQAKNRARQTRYYNAHKDKILQKKQADRAAVKVLNTPVPEVIIPTEYTLDMIQEILNKIENENTKRKYTNDIKRLFTLSGIQKFTGTMVEFNLIKNSVENSNYSLSTRKGTIQSILVFLEKSGMLIDNKVKARYALLYDVLVVKTTDEHAEKVKDTNNDVMLYSDYIQLVLNKFGDDSKEYLVGMMYNEVTVRDNFGGLKIIDSFDCDDGKGNFLLKNGDFTIILNDYKTSKIYEKQIFTLSVELADLLTNYIDKHELADFLFPTHVKKGLSQTVISMNKKIGVVGGINTIRKMKISTFLQQDNLTAEDRLKQSRSMCHSIGVQQKYRRGIKKGVIEPLLLAAIKN